MLTVIGVIADLVSVRNVAAWRSYVNIAATVGRALGGPIGGWPTDTIGWRWSFFGQCPLTVIGLFLIIWKLPNSVHNASLADKDETLRKKIQRIDFAGAISLAIVITAFLLTLDFIANELAWYLILVPALTFALFATLFCLTESRWA
jgi:predicted MFS family arabinose efflux permease